MTAFYVATGILGLVAARVLHVAVQAAIAEHRDPTAPVGHHLARLAWWSALFGLLSLLFLPLLPAVA